MLWLFLSLTLKRASELTLELAPYVVVGVLCGEAVRYTPASRLLERSCRGHPMLATTLASLLGVISPLCTYGTVPIVLQLVRTGVPIAPLGAFLATSSLINPQLFAITWGGLGSALATADLISVFAFGLLLGGILHAVPERWTVRPLLREAPEPGPHGVQPFTFRGFASSSSRSLQFVGFYVLVGILLGAAVEVIVPGQWLVGAFAATGWLQILMAALLGIPLYACGGGAIPLLGYLLREGMVPGAALAFLVAGPATRITPLLALAAVMRPRFVGLYVAGLLAYSVLVGLAYSAVWAF